MTEQSLSRFFGGGLFNNWCFEDGIFFIIILLLLLCGDELLEWIFCNPEMLIWIVILILFFGAFDFFYNISKIYN